MTENAESVDSHIERFRSNMKSVPDVEPGAIDNFVNIFKKQFRQNSTDAEVIEGTVCLFEVLIEYSFNIPMLF